MELSTNIPRIIISGVSSNVGKTTIVSALASLMRKNNIKVKCFKCGPDYLDPTYHQNSSGHESHNLDTWLMGKEGVVKTFIEESEGFDFAIIEGVMGLFDGKEARGESGSTSELAKCLMCPVILTVDVSGMARSVSALVNGFLNFDPDLNIVGVILNKLGSEGHLNILKEALGEIKVLGGMLKGEDEKKFPGRHLGLLAARDNIIPKDTFEYWENNLARFTDIEKIITQGKATISLSCKISSPKKRLKNCKIAYALDDAFHFYYPENLKMLRAGGAELIPFSPIKDKVLPKNIGGIYLGGGYPECYANELSSNVNLIGEIKKFADGSGPIYAECGGLIYLAQKITTKEGKAYSMLGLIDGEITLFDKLMALGYCEVETTRNGILGPMGIRFKGHQFRYSNISNIGASSPLFKIKRRGLFSEEGFGHKNVLGTYVHAHWASNPEIPTNFINAIQGMGIN